MRFKIEILFIIVALMFTCAVCNEISEEDNIEYIGSTLWSKVYDIEIDGNYAYCSFINGLVILDISNKKEPVFVSQLYLGGGNGIDIKDKYAFVASGDKGLFVINISDPRVPVLEGFYDTAGESNEVIISAGKPATPLTKYMLKQFEDVHLYCHTIYLQILPAQSLRFSV